MAQTSRIDVTIEYAPFAKLPDGRYRINSWVIVTEGRDKTPMANETVMFLIDGIEDGDLPTNNKGRTDRHAFYASPESTGVVIEARLERVPSHRDRKTVSFITITDPKTADSWKVNVIPEGDKRYLFVRIFTQNNIGVEGIQVYINPRLFRDDELITSAKGVIGPLEIEQKEDTRTYTVTAPETNLQSQTFTVVGKPRWKRPDKVPKKEVVFQLIRHKRSYDPWQNVLTALRTAWELFKQRREGRN